MKHGARLVVIAFALAACRASSGAAPPQAQVIVHVDTDAPVAHASAAESPSWTDPIPLFDRLHVDLFPPGATAPCDSCTNEFSVSYEQLAASLVSFARVPAQGDDGWVARVRLTVERFELSTGELDPAVTIDEYVAIPPVAEGQVLDVSVVLPTGGTGQTTGSLQAPAAPAPGAPGASVVGTWSSAQRVTCASAAPAGAVCVPGGAFWMGASSDALVPGASQTWRRLVVLSPFWLRTKEVTVAEARGHVDAGQVESWSGSTDGSSAVDFCTYLPSPGARDVLPITCVTQQGAAGFCAGQGGALPSEAQLEYASGGALGQPYPWGYDQPDCSEAIWGRGGYGLFLDYIPQVCLAKTNFMQPMGGPEPPGKGTWDVLALPGGSVFDLAGNVYELAADTFQYSTEPCWAPTGVLRDPVCTQPSDPPPSHAVRGGSWDVGGSYLEAGHRLQLLDGMGQPDTGFRCAWPGE